MPPRQFTREEAEQLLPRLTELLLEMRERRGEYNQIAAQAVELDDKMRGNGQLAQADLKTAPEGLEEAHQSLLEALKSADPERFAEEAGGDSLKAIVERASDDVNLYYGRLAARAMSLPQPPCLQRADFSSLREAVAALQVAHRRFTN